MRYLPTFGDDTEGKRVRTIRRSDNLLSIVRAIMLYDERLPN